MKFSPNENVLRVSLIVFCILFGIFSICLITLGAVYVEELTWPRNFVGLDFLELPTLVIILGALSLVMAVTGCFCAKNYNRKFFLIFGAVLTVILCMELAISIIAFINTSEEKNQERFNSLHDKYVSDNINDKNQFDTLAKHYQCCGVTGEESECTEVAPYKASPIVQIKGCAEVVNSDIRRIARQAGYFSSILAFLQLLQITCVYTIFYISNK